MRLIDADKLIERTKEFSSQFEIEWTTNKVIAWIDNAQTEDTACVIRCKNCKHSGMYCFGDNSIETLACLDIEDDGFIRFAKSVDPDGFCSFGELR